MLKSILNSSRQFVRKMIIRFIPVIYYELDNYERQRVLDRLTCYGEDVLFQLPVVVSGDVSFGDKVSLAAYVHIWGEGGVIIGNQVMIGSHTAIVSLTHDKQAEQMWKTEVKKSVIIHDNVWIGTHCVIMPGVEIGRGSIIGAGSVVTESVAENTICYGVPAVAVRQRI